MKLGFISKQKAQRLIDAEFERALGVKRLVLRQWARDANYNVYTSQDYRKALAAFQQLEQIMGPAYDYDALRKEAGTPYRSGQPFTTISEGLYGNAGS